MGDSGFHLELRHNTIEDNADGYTATSGSDLLYFDFDNVGNPRYDVLAHENWWGTTDATTIDAHIRDLLDSNLFAQVLYTALGDTLAFSVTAPTGPLAGGTPVVIEAETDAPPFVPSAGNPLNVTFGGNTTADLEVSADGRRITVIIPAHAAGAVDVVVTNPGGQTGTLAGGFTYVEPFVDTDEDGVDNCPITANDDQSDLDEDGEGNACDDDANGNGVLDADEARAEADTGGCGCTTAAPGSRGGLILLLGVLGLRRRQHP
ncbi:MAG: hypothetical protein JRJ84_24235 [Deltaproteobacteria bacterium]|nr:hypothetical protein [Deltaproteobacteria bacterium]